MPETTPIASQPKAPKPYACRHIFTDGHQCGSPALRGEALCFYHHGSRRPQQHQTVHGHTFLALPEPLDLHAVQRSLAELLRILALDALPRKQAALMLRTLATCSQNLSRIDRQAAAARHLNPERTPVDEYTNHPTLGTIAPAPLVSADEIPTLTQQQTPNTQQPTLVPLEPTPRPEGPLPDPRSLFTLKPIVTDRPSARAVAEAEEHLARTLESTARQIHDRAERRARLDAAVPDIGPLPPGVRYNRGDSDFLNSFPQLEPLVAALEAQTLPQTPQTPSPDPETYPQPNEDFGLLNKSLEVHPATAEAPFAPAPAHPFEYAEACA